MDLAKTNSDLIDTIKRTKVDTSYLYDFNRLLDEKIGFLAQNCDRVLDFGKSSRERFDTFREQQIITSDINQFDDYPDVVDDVCNIQNLPWESFDGIICMAILEHVYAPHKACENIYRLLKPGGHVLVYTPFFFRYHAPRDLVFQDYFRFSRDALAYLFRGFSDVTIYPMRGRYSTIFNMFGSWKARVEKGLGQRVNRAVDRVLGIVFGDKEQVLQASGYSLWAKK